MMRIIWYLRLWIYFLFVYDLSDSRQSTTSLVAILDMQGFRGTVEFHSNPSRSPFEEVLIRVDLNGLVDSDPLVWSIWQNPADLTQKDPCNKDKLGTELVDLSGMYGRIRTGQEVLVRDAFRALKPSTLFERTLVVQSVRYGWRACALIRSSVPVATYESQFLSPIGGYFAVRQLPNLATSIRADLLWTDGTSRNARLDWSLVKIVSNPERWHHESSLLCERTCSHLWELIASDLTTPLFVSRDASRSVTVGGGVNPLHWTFLVETNFTSLEAMDMRDIWVVLQRSPEDFVACAPLWTAHPREAVAEFHNAPYVQGFVHLYQPSGYGDATVVTVNLTLAKRNAAGFGIDELPLAYPSSHSGFRGECTTLALDYFNPMGIDPQSSPAPRAGTADRYSVGDLGSKSGTLLDKDQLQTSFYDQYLTLHGTNGAIGRSVVVYEDSWYPLACATLRTGTEETVAIADFVDQVTGRVTFQQHLQEPFGMHTSIHVNLQHKELENSTANHKWKIHLRRKSNRKRTTRSTDSAPTGCQDLGQVYNPYGAFVGPNRCGCSQATPLRCTLGDLSGRLGPIHIAQSHEATEATGTELTDGRFLVDSGLWLAGDFSVIGMVLVLYESDYSDDILACATIQSDVP